MHLAALLIGLIACVAIIVLGIRFFLQPRQATLDFGIAVDNLRGLTEIKGARDITSGVVPLVAWASAGSTTLGWVLVAAAITPTADALIVHKRREALKGIGCPRAHGGTARRCGPRSRAGMNDPGDDRASPPTQMTHGRHSRVRRTVWARSGPLQADGRLRASHVQARLHLAHRMLTQQESH